MSASRDSAVATIHASFSPIRRFGDARGYRQQVEVIRRSYEDIKASDAARSGGQG
jgi:hypothetical protein